MPNTVQIMKKELVLLDDLNQLTDSVKLALNATLQQLDESDNLPPRHHEAIRLFNQADHAATSVQNAVTAPDKARTPAPTTPDDLAHEVNEIRKQASGNRMASSLDTGTKPVDQDFDSYLNDIARKAISVAEDALQLYQDTFPAGIDPSVEFMCCMAVLSAGSVVACTEHLRPNLNKRSIIIPA